MKCLCDTKTICICVNNNLQQVLKLKTMPRKHIPCGTFLVVKTIKQTKKRNLYVAWSLLRYTRVILEKFGKLNFL